MGKFHIRRTALCTLHCAVINSEESISACLDVKEIVISVKCEKFF